MTAYVLVAIVTFFTAQGGIEQRQITRPIANAQACSAALAHLRAADLRPTGRVIHMEAACVPAVPPERTPPPARGLPKDAA